MVWEIGNHIAAYGCERGVPRGWVGLRQDPAGLPRRYGRRSGMLNSRLIKLMMASSILTPPTRMEWLMTTLPSDITNNQVPPPMSTIMQPPVKHRQTAAKRCGKRRFHQIYLTPAGILIKPSSRTDVRCRKWNTGGEKNSFPHFLIRQRLEPTALRVKYCGSIWAHVKIRDDALEQKGLTAITPCGAAKHNFGVIAYGARTLRSLELSTTTMVGSLTTMPLPLT